MTAPIPAPALQRAELRPAGSPRAARGARILLGLALLGVAFLAGAQDVRVSEVRTRLVDDTFVLNARIDYDFSAPVLDALDNGVPLTLETHIQVRRANGWLWEDSLVDQRLRHRIRYKPLSKTYLIAALPESGGRAYLSRDAAITALGEIADMQLLNRQRLDPDARYEVHIKVALDVEELPLPLRPMAYLHPSWKQASDWTRWPLEP